MRSDKPFELCLGDFGASIDVSEQKDFQAHLFIGTPGYFPPEMNTFVQRDKASCRVGFVD